MAWAGSLVDDPAVATALGDLGEGAWRKIHNYGPRSKLVGNAVLWALSALGTNAAIAQLTRINSKLKHASARKLAEKAMNHVAEVTGQTREDLEELAVPTFEMRGEGMLARTIEEFTCTLALTREFLAEISIADAAGKVRKTVPAALKAHADFKALQKMLKQLNALLPSQRLRMESLLRLPERSWSYENWHARYVRHPLLRQIARRLIWRFTTEGVCRSAMLVNETLTTADNVALEPPGAQARVQLWHPCTDGAENVVAWRRFLEQRRITQPFKQAHREIYLLTDAERNTRSYSNRFAAHIIRQHQFNALCAARGWRYKLQGGWDGGDATPTLELPALQMKVEFWVEMTGIEQGLRGEGVSATGVALNLTTDQVRFYGRVPQMQLALEEVQPQVFSEVMRDVDLFVGVCSVANDPTWADGGPNGLYLQYWRGVSFGELNATAQTRREILATLLPRLAIGAQCSLMDKFLRVEGSIRTYKIHLGSGNILMEPNDEYLCIVPNQSVRARKAEDLYLPFEGDSTLSVILSKAFLLAADKKIVDPTITRQLGAI